MKTREEVAELRETCCPSIMGLKNVKSISGECVDWDPMCNRCWSEALVGYEYKEENNG